MDRRPSRSSRARALGLARREASVARRFDGIGSWRRPSRRKRRDVRRRLSRAGLSRGWCAKGAPALLRFYHAKPCSRTARGGSPSSSSSSPRPGVRRARGHGPFVVVTLIPRGILGPSGWARRPPPGDRCVLRWPAPSRGPVVPLDHCSRAARGRAVCPSSKGARLRP